MTTRLNQKDRLQVTMSLLRKNHWCGSTLSLPLGEAILEAFGFFHDNGNLKQLPLIYTVCYRTCSAGALPPALQGDHPKRKEQPP